MLFIVHCALFVVHRLFSLFITFNIVRSSWCQYCVVPHRLIASFALVVVSFTSVVVPFSFSFSLILSQRASSGRLGTRTAPRRRLRGNARAGPRLKISSLVPSLAQRPPESAQVIQLCTTTSLSSVSVGFTDAWEGALMELRARRAELVLGSHKRGNECHKNQPTPHTLPAYMPGRAVRPPPHLYIPSCTRDSR